MTDLERRIRDLLDEDARLAPPPREPGASVRRTRRRQASLVIVGVLTAVALVIGAVTGLRAVLRSSPMIPVGEVDTRTVTIAGVSITYPSAWTVVDAWPLAAQIATSSGTTTGGSDGSGSSRETQLDVPSGLPILELSNVDLGLTPGCSSLAPGLHVELPNDLATLSVAYDVDEARKQGPDPAVATWPVQLNPGPGPCGDGDYAHWRSATGTPYIAYARFGPGASSSDRQAVLDAFASMSFDTLLLEPPAERTAGYVLDGLRVGTTDYTLEARPASGGGVDLSLVNGRQPQSGPISLSGVGRSGDPDLQAARTGLLRVGSADTCQAIGVVCQVAFGVASNRVSSVRVDAPTVGAIEARVVPIPASLGTSFLAFDVQIPPETGETITALDADGNVIAEEALSETVSASPAPTAASEAQSELRNALAAALTYFTDGRTFEGFDPPTATSIEPTIAFNTSDTAAETGVSIRDVTARTILLVTKARDGTVFCIAFDRGQATYGTTDAHLVTQCDGDVSAWGGG